MKKETLMENAETYGLAAAGFAQGVTKEMLTSNSERKISAATIAWGGLAAGVIAYDALCPDGQTLSEGVDQALKRKRLLTIGAVITTSAHLLNAIPEQIDPFHQFAKRSRKLFRP